LLHVAGEVTQVDAVDVALQALAVVQRDRRDVIVEAAQAGRLNVEIGAGVAKLLEQPPELRRWQPGREILRPLLVEVALRLLNQLRPRRPELRPAGAAPRAQVIPRVDAGPPELLLDLRADAGEVTEGVAEHEDRLREHVMRAAGATRPSAATALLYTGGTPAAATSFRDGRGRQ
jgi:hypothetical protein